MDNREKLEKQKERMEKQRREDAALTKTLYWLAGALVLEGVVFLLKRFLIEFELTEEAIDLSLAISRVVLAAAVAGLVLAALFAAAAVLRRRKTGSSGLTPWVLAVFFLWLGVVCALIWRYRETAVGLLIYLIPVAAVLALIYYLYQREFFSEALCSALGIIGVWFALSNVYRSSTVYLAIAGVAVLLVVIAALTGVLQSRKGVLTLKSGETRILPENANYALIYVSCALSLAVIAASLMLGGTINVMLYYAAPVAWVLVMAVYHTVKLM